MKTSQITTIVFQALKPILPKLGIDKPSKKTINHLEKAAKKLAKQLKSEAKKTKKKKGEKPSKKKSPNVVKANPQA